jgi:hypothetical protein
MDNIFSSSRVDGNTSQIRYFPWAIALILRPKPNYSLIIHLLGTALVRFEPATNPPYGGGRVVHLRITKMVGPISRHMRFEGSPASEGQLLTRSYHGVGPPEPWAYDIDKDSAMATALRVLWDNSRIPSVWICPSVQKLMPLPMNPLQPHQCPSSSLPFSAASSHRRNILPLQGAHTVAL